MMMWYFGRGSFQWPRKQTRNESPHEVLKKRFSRGGISNKEYEEQKKLLEG
jgi:uncharacterized membrane protein